MTEQQIQKQCLNWLQSNGFFAWKNHVGPIFVGNSKKMIPNPAKGSPDILAVKEGIFYGIEVKKRGNRLSPHQRDWHEKAQRIGGAVCLVVYSQQDLIDQIEGWDDF
jgi:hypothetical protein